MRDRNKICLKKQKTVSLKNGQFTATLFWPEQKLSHLFPYLKNSFNTAAPLIRPDFCGLLVTGLTGPTVYTYMYPMILSLLQVLT